MGSANQNPNLDEFEDMIWCECENCGLIQLKELVPLDKLYQKAHNPAIGKTWEKHHKDFSAFILENTTKTDLSKVVELGGGNLKLYNNLKFNVKNYVVLDTHEYEKDEKNDNLTFIKQLFDLNTLNIKPTLTIHSHTFEHFYEPVKTFIEIYNILEENGLMVASIPNIANVINDGYGNGINFEHSFVISKKTIRNFLKFSGFELVKIINYSPYNFFIVAKKTTSIEKVFSYEKQRNYFNNFILKSSNLISKINSNIKEKEKSFIFGCHIFTQYLLNIDPNIENLFNGVLDNDPAKVGQRLYGCNLQTFSPSLLKNIENPSVVLAAGVYTNEIKKQLLEINSNTNFVEM
jgi:hypothetical protein